MWVIKRKEGLIQLKSKCFYELHIEFCVKYSKFEVQEPVSEKFAICSIFISQIEQRMSNSLSTLCTDLEEELVSLYSTPIDEEAFKMEDDEILNQENLL